MRPPIHSVKHYVQTSLTTVGAPAPAILAIELVKAENISAVSLVQDVQEGSIIKAVYVEYWLRTPDTVGGSAIVTLEKLPGAAVTNMTTAESAALGNYDNKKNVLYTFMGLVNDQSADALAPVRGWIKIPKSKQRFGLNDKLFLNVHANTTIDVLICGFCTYKEYT